MPTTQKAGSLVQVRLPREIYKKLCDRMRVSGDISMAAYIRRVLTVHVNEVTHGEE
jgi:hypothetical protein